MVNSHVERVPQCLPPTFGRVDVDYNANNFSLWAPNSANAEDNKAERRPEIATLAPFASNAFAIAKPIPFEPPVTRPLFPTSVIAVAARAGWALTGAPTPL